MNDLVNSTALAKQEGGDHYKKLAIQPVEYIHANGIGYFEGNVIKYVTRWHDKGGIADLHKAKHYIELLVELELKAQRKLEKEMEITQAIRTTRDRKGDREDDGERDRKGDA
jgi:hypothetical protein